MKKFQMGLAAALMLTAIACTSEEPQAEKPSGWEQKTITFTFGDDEAKKYSGTFDFEEIDGGNKIGGIIHNKK